MYRAALDARPADWVVASLRTFGKSVLSVLPAGFAEYVRVFHPGRRGTGSDRAALGWAEIARANGRKMHAAAQFPLITGTGPFVSAGQPGVFDEAPARGNLPCDLLDSLASALALYTTTPGACYFAMWEGWGGLPADMESAPTFSVPGRTYHLLTGSVEAVRELVRWDWRWDRSPSLWWPEDHAWCFATDVDSMTTYIGTDHRCAQQLLSLSGVEAAPVSPDLGIDWLSDTVNPRPRQPGP